MTTWVQIASMDAPSSNVFDFPSLTLTAYTAVQIVGSGITVTADDSDLILTVYQGGSETTGASTYAWGGHLDVSSGSGNTDQDNAAVKILLTSNDVNFGVGNAAGEGIGFIATFDTPSSGSLKGRVRFESAFTQPAGNCVGAEGAGTVVVAAIGGFKISGESNLTAGKVRVLGLA